MPMSLNLLFLPLSLSTVLSMNRVLFPIDTRIAHYTPLLIEKSRFLSGSLMKINSFAPLTLDRTEFAGRFKQISSSTSAPVKITRCQFANFYESPLTIENASILKVKWCAFESATRSRAINIKHVRRAIIDTCNFTALGSGAVLVDSSVMVMKNCRFVGAHADNGAAVHARESETEIRHCLFHECCADEFGGAVALIGGKAVMEHNAFSNNEARRGNAVFTEGAQARILDSDFDGTQGTEIVGDVVVIDCKFKSNGAHVLAPPTSTETFTPVATGTPLPPLATAPPAASPRNIKLLIGCCAGIGCGLLVIAVIVVIVIKVKGYNTPKIYVKDMTEKRPPSGSVYISHTYSLAK